MGFFNPALLWFALGGAIPIIIHLLHRQKFKRVRWAAMEFLLNALKKTRRRMQLENLLLLLLRKRGWWRGIAQPRGRRVT